MAQPSPTIEGFRAAFRRPGIPLAEISWRWGFGAAAWVLLALSVFEFLDTLRVSRGDRFLLRTGQPLLVSHAIGHILHGSTPRVIASLLILAVCLSGLWMLAASLGRAATVSSLLAYFNPDGSQDKSEEVGGPGARWPRQSLFGLNFLRVALALAAVLALVASGVIAGFASSDAHPHPGLVFVIFIALALLIWLCWSSVNWFLSVAPIFALHDHWDTFGSVSAAMDFCRQRTSAVFWSSTAFGAIHVVVFAAATSVVVFPLAFAGVVPGWVVTAALLVLTLLYFAVVDFLYTGRLAAYICILSTPPAPEPMRVVLSPAPLPGPPRPSSAWYATDDDILSDLPGLLSPDQPSR